MKDVFEHHIVIFVLFFAMVGFIARHLYDEYKKPVETNTTFRSDGSVINTAKNRFGREIHRSVEPPGSFFLHPSAYEPDHKDIH